MAKIRRACGRLAVLFTLAGTAAFGADRTFDFDYAFSVTGLRPGQAAKVWVPLARSDDAQDVTVTGRHLPAGARATTDRSGLNQMVYADAVADRTGVVGMSIEYHVVRREIRSSAVRDHEDVSADLLPNRLVPNGGRAGKLLDVKAIAGDDSVRARAAFDFVFDYMAYAKDKPGWGRGDVDWVCDNRSGNCVDFHSLFLSLVRTGGIPAKMEFGFIVPGPDRPVTVGNYHAWALFKPSSGDRWVPVDISKAKNRPAEKESFFARLDADRFGFTTGRDVVLSPPQGGPPLNYFIYPYAEVDGQAWPAEKIARSFAVVRTPTTAPSAVR